MPSLLRILLVVGLIGPLTPSSQGQQVEPFEEPPINYSATPTNDRATAISAKFQSRAMEIRSMPAKKRLQWLLDELGVPVESQIFVFSKTSLQRDLINPEAPAYSTSPTRPTSAGPRPAPSRSQCSTPN